VANETTTTSANDAYVTVLHNAILEERRPAELPWRMFHTKADPIGKGITAQFAIQDDPGAAGALTEATDASNTQLTTSAQTATASEQGIMATITDRLAAVAVVDAYDHFGGVLARSYQERMNDIFCGFYDDFSNTTGSSGADLTILQFVTAVAALAGRDVPGPYWAVVHPQQILDLQAGSGNTPGGVLTALSSMSPYFGNDNFSAEDLLKFQRMGSGPYRLFDVEIYTSSSVVTANSGADRAGAVFNKEAIGYHELWDQRTELQRDASLRATEVVVTGCIGAVEVDDARGQSIITDA
jgi:hypothetical protein